jgi:Dihydroorotate dehydrogenase
VVNPLFQKLNDVLTKVSNVLGKERTIIGVGGIDSYESANEKFRLGANLLQLYTGLVYKGPRVIEDILRH